jgi:short-subunit dehydrogenase
MKLTHRVAAITGAGSGIGRALALALAERGCSLALSDIDANSLAETALLLERSRAPKVVCTTVDVAVRKDVHDWAEATEGTFKRVNLVFNNAGVAQAGSVEANSYEDYEWMMGINFWGVVYGTKAFLPLLKRSGEGHIVNISSVFGLFAQPTQSAYNASKFAVRGFTEALRLELDLMKCGVSATCVHPGGIKTNIVKASRLNASSEALLGGSKEQSAAAFEKLFRTTPEQAADIILRGVARNARRVLVGIDAWSLDSVQRLLPSAYQRIIGDVVRRQKDKSA